MEPYKIEAYRNLGRALFGAYNVHSGGKAWDGKDVPSWSEIFAREHDEAGTSPRPGLMPCADGVIAHWAYVACCASTDPEAAQARAEYLDAKYADHEVYQRVTQ